MARVTVGKNIDKYITLLESLGSIARGMCGEAVYQGAKIVTDEIRKSIDSIPAEKIDSVQRQGLKDGLGIATMRDDMGYYNVKVGMDGYNNRVTKTYPRGQPNAMIARSIESGTSFSSKYPFILPAVKRTQEQAEKKMAEVVEMRIEQQMK